MVPIIDYVLSREAVQILGSIVFRLILSENMMYIFSNASASAL